MTVAPRLFYVDPPHTPQSSPAPAENDVDDGDDHGSPLERHDMKTMRKGYYSSGLEVCLFCSGKTDIYHMSV